MDVNVVVSSTVTVSKVVEREIKVVDRKDKVVSGWVVTGGENEEVSSAVDVGSKVDSREDEGRAKVGVGSLVDVGSSERVGSPEVAGSSGVGSAVVWDERVEGSV